MNFLLLDKRIEAFFKQRFENINTTENKFVVFALFVMGIMGLFSAWMLYHFNNSIGKALYIGFASCISITLAVCLMAEGVKEYKQKESSL